MTEERLSVNWAFGGTGLCRQDTQQLGHDRHHWLFETLSQKKKKWLKVMVEMFDSS